VTTSRSYIGLYLSLQCTFLIGAPDKRRAEANSAITASVLFLPFVSSFFKAYVKARLGSTKFNIKKFYVMPAGTCCKYGRYAYKITVAKSGHMRLFVGPMFRLEYSIEIGSSRKGCEAVD
jgi:hypothetical protein